MNIETTTNAIVTLEDGTKETITCTQERANELSDNLYKAQQSGMDLYFNICEYVAEIRDSKAYYLLGYSSFKDFAQDKFESGETQAKNMCLIASSYGSQRQDGSYTIIDKDNLKEYTATQLYYIRGLNGFTGNIITTVEKYGINKDIRTADLRALIKEEKSLIKDGKLDKKGCLTYKDFKAIKPIDSVLEDKTKEAKQEAKEAKQEAKEAKQEAKVAKQEAKEAKQEAKAGKDFRHEVIKILNTDKSANAKIKCIEELVRKTK